MFRPLQDHHQAKEVACNIKKIHIYTQEHKKKILNCNANIFFPITYLYYLFLNKYFSMMWKVPGSIPGGVTGDFFRGIRQSHVPGVDSAS
jgi:hypothetical protein